MKHSIIIVGAGASGLLAAKQLASKFEVTVLEATNRVGGRIHTIIDGENIIEAGAEFIHGKLPLTFRLLKKAGLDYQPVSGEFYRKENGTLQVEQDMIPGWDELLKQMKKQKEDTDLNSFLDKRFPGDKFDDLCSFAKSYAEGFDLADPGKASVKALYREWRAESTRNYRIPAGYSALLSHLEKQIVKKGGKIIPDSTVRSIHWQKGKVEAVTVRGKRFQSDKILVTVPLGVLCKPAAAAGSSCIEFTPEIEAQRNAARNIGFGPVIKAVLKFKQPFWNPDTGFVFSDEKYFPTWWTKLPGIAPLLTGWIGGPPAASIAEDTDDDILQKALASLSTIFDKPFHELREELVDAKIFNWCVYSTALGGYSYEKPGSKKAKKILNTPLLNTLFFTGEGLYSGKFPGTVEAAFQHAEEVVKKIKG